MIGELSAQIEAMQKAITITAVDDVSWRVDWIARQLAGLHDKTINITTIYRTIGGGAASVIQSGSAGYSGSGSESGDGYIGGSAIGSPNGSYANGTNYVPRTGLYMLHRGEAVAKEPVISGLLAGRSAAAEPQRAATNQTSIKVGDINIIVPESAAPQRPEDWRMITRQYIVPELENIRRA